MRQSKNGKELPGNKIAKQELHELIVKSTKELLQQTTMSSGIQNLEELFDEFILSHIFSGSPDETRSGYRDCVRTLIGCMREIEEIDNGIVFDSFDRKPLKISNRARAKIILDTLSDLTERFDYETLHLYLKDILLEWMSSDQSNDPKKRSLLFFQIFCLLDYLRAIYSLQSRYEVTC